MTYRLNAAFKPIETEYNGYLFRSRLEARYGVFFDALEIPWEYEIEGFDMGGIWYLPDFWLPSLGCWAEIKGPEPTEEEIDKIEMLAKGTGYPAGIFYGLPGQYPGQFWAFNMTDSSGGWSFNNVVHWCLTKNGIPTLTLADRGRVIINPRDNFQELKSFSQHWTKLDVYSPIIKAACLKAKQARFEHQK